MCQGPQRRAVGTPEYYENEVGEWFHCHQVIRGRVSPGEQTHDSWRLLLSVMGMHRSHHRHIWHIQLAISLSEIKAEVREPFLEKEQVEDILEEKRYLVCKI